MDKKTHFTIQFICFAILFALILLQSFTGFIPMRPLEGFDKEESAPVKLTFETYLDSTFQDYMTEHAKRNTGFREFFIRSYNQMAYSCFGKVTNNNVVRGRNHELFLKMYLDDEAGNLLWGVYPDVETAKADARKNVEETLRLIDTLRQHGTEFLFVFAPSKTKVYPEWMPKQYHSFGFSMQEYYIELFKENNIPHIDFLNYFRSIKDTVPYPLYSRMGTHWAEWTIPWVTDSILRKIEDLTSYNLPSTMLVDTNLTTDYFVMDRELEGEMNLLFPLPKPALPNPTFVYTDTVGKDRPGLLVISDSYANQLVRSGFGEVFDHWDLWIYNKEIYSSRPRYNWHVLKEEIDAAAILGEADVVVAVFTAPMYYNFMFGFPKTVQNIYKTGYVDEEEALKTIVGMIKSDAKWYNGVVEQAEKRQISIDASVMDNAKYYLEFKRQINLQKTQ